MSRTPRPLTWGSGSQAALPTLLCFPDPQPQEGSSTRSPGARSACWAPAGAGVSGADRYSASRDTGTHALGPEPQTVSSMAACLLVGRGAPSPEPGKEEASLASTLIPSWLKMNLGAEVFRSSSLEDKNNTTYKYTCKDPNVGQAPSLSGQGRLCAFPHVPACQLAE